MKWGDFNMSINVNNPESKIIETVESLREEILDFTCRLVTKNSVLGNEQPVMALMAEELTKLSFKPEMLPIDQEALQNHPGFASVPWDYTNKQNVVAVREADATGGKSAIVNGHLDVVDPEPVTFWDSDPFEPQLKDNKIFGRGAGDMKSGVAAMTYAVHALDKAGFGLCAPVTIQAVVEEECCGNGALALMQAGYDAEAILIPEPFGPTILTSQLGVLWFKVTVGGKPVHVLEAQAGTNAIEKLFPLIQLLRELEQEMNTEAVPEAYQGVDHPINLNIGIVQGGNWPSTVAAEAEFHGRLSYFPGTGYQSVCQRILQTIKQAEDQDPWLKENAPSIEFYGFRSDGHTVSRTLPALETLNGCHHALTGQDAQEYIATCTTDLRAFHFYGNGQCTCFGPMGGSFHGANEWVDMESIIHTAKTYALFLARWCGLVE
jgi:acetylornithine deacetylase